MSASPKRSCAPRSPRATATAGETDQNRPAPRRKTLEEFDFTFQRSVRETVIEHLGQLDLWPGHVITDTIVLGAHFTPGQHEVIGAQEVANGQVKLNIVTMDAEEPVPTCFAEKGALG